MKRIRKSIVVLFLVSIGCMAIFQNCSGDFKVDPKLQEVQLRSLDGGYSEIPDFSAEILSGTASVDPTTLEANEDYTVSFVGTPSPYVEYTYDLTSNSAYCVLSPGPAPLARTLHCPQDGGAVIRVIATHQSGATKQNSVAVMVGGGTVGATPTPTPDPGIVSFHIANGTGTNSWNTMATTIVAFVGQRIRLYNDDTIQHQLHTNGSPCAHQPAPTAPGGTFDCVVGSAHENVNAGDTYDHLVGTTAKVFIKTLDGAAKYATNCQSCHGTVAASTKRFQTVSAIRRGINTVGAMSGLSSLTDEDLGAIAWALSH